MPYEDSLAPRHSLDHRNLLSGRLRLGLSPKLRSRARRNRISSGRMWCLSPFRRRAQFANVGKRYDRKRLKQFILDPDAVYRERGMQSLNPGYPRMPRPGVSDSDADAIIAYLQTLK